MTDLEQIVRLSREFGTPDYVRGGGGNTSVKSPDTLWVKPSGTTLAGLTAETFVAMNRVAMRRLYEMDVPSDAAAREERVKDVMASAVLPGSSGRPSVEAPLHELLAGKFVVHTHPALVNGMTCSRRGAATVARLFPESLWIPYVDPGFTLCMEVRRMVREYVDRKGRAPSLLFLENHGVFITGDTDEAIRSAYRHVMDLLRAEYARAGISTELAIAAPMSAERIEADRKALVAAMGGTVSATVHSGVFPVAGGPVSPDHIVYSKSYAYRGALQSGPIQAFQAEHGYLPRVVVSESGVFGVAATLKQAGLALELARDGALVCQLAEAFGGIQFMSDRARLFIENWEVESYRQEIADKP